MRETGRSEDIPSDCFFEVADYFTLRAAIKFPLPGLRRKTVRLGEGADGERDGIGLDGGVPIASENNSPVKKD